MSERVRARPNRRHGAVAIVESPFQLMSLCEAVVAGAVDELDDVLVRVPSAASDAVAALAPSTVQRALREAVAPTALIRAARGTDQLVIGDAFGALAQAASIAHRGPLVLLEDGAASVRLWAALTSTTALVRAHDRELPRRVLAALARRVLRRRARRGAVRVVNGLPGAPAGALAAAGFDLVPHRFAWARGVVLDAARAGLPPGTRRVVVGSALAADGHVDGAWYRDWVLVAMAVEGAHFVPHRRDPPDVVDAVGGRAGGAAGDLPVELLVRDAPGHVEVWCLPSTPALTVPLVRTGPTTLVCDPIPEAVWTPHAAPSMRALLAALTTLVDAQR